jgi:hypothetical protein
VVPDQDINKDDTETVISPKLVVEKKMQLLHSRFPADVWCKLCMVLVVFSGVELYIFGVVCARAE